MSLKTSHVRGYSDETEDVKKIQLFSAGDGFYVSLAAGRRSSQFDRKKRFQA